MLSNFEVKINKSKIVKTHILGVKISVFKYKQCEMCLKARLIHI